MNQNTNTLMNMGSAPGTLNHDLMVWQTGDPFADLGAYVWKELNDRYFQGLSPLQIIEKVAKIYINDWDQKLHPFFANSYITHNTYSGQKDKSLKETLSYYEKIFNHDTEFASPNHGHCRLTSIYTTLFSIDRRNTILIGSGGLSNFNHGMEEGAIVCKEIIFRLFFIPLGAIPVGSMPAVITSNISAISEKFAQSNLHMHFSSIAKGASGIQKSNSGRASNALFDFASRCIDLDLDQPENTALDLYHFSNFVNGPNLVRYRFPAMVFKFHASCLRRYRTEWSSFIWAHYLPDKKTKIQNDEDPTSGSQIESTKNLVFERILNNDPLSYLALNWIKKGNRLPFKIIELYQILIRHMDKKTLQLLARIAKFIVENRQDDAVKSTISKLNRAKGPRDIRLILLKLIQENYDSGNEHPIIRLEEVEYLFPEGFSSSELRDILLIGVYEQLHESNRQIEVEAIETTDNDEDNSSNT